MNGPRSAHGKQTGTRTLDQTATIKDWLGRTRREDDDVSLGAVRRLAAMLDQDPEVYRPGSPVPESWYALLFGPTTRQSQMGLDGHPRTGDDFLPPMKNMRRMFAGRRATFHRPLHIGELVERVSTVSRVESKTGRSGAFTLLTVTHEMAVDGRLAVTEEQDLVYRAAVEAPAAGGGAASRPATTQPAAEPADWSTSWTPDTVALFRYSALTFNAHRIHYDLPYTREVEGYPALVINGGLTALMLIETARAQLGGKAFARYDARANAPIFIGQTVTLNGRRSADGATLWAVGPDGGTAYRLDVSIASG